MVVVGTVVWVSAIGSWNKGCDLGVRGEGKQERAGGGGVSDGVVDVVGVVEVRVGLKQGLVVAG